MSDVHEGDCLDDSVEYFYYPVGRTLRGYYSTEVGHNKLRELYIPSSELSKDQLKQRFKEVMAEIRKIKK